jgi:hypothetical protein
MEAFEKVIGKTINNVIETLTETKGFKNLNFSNISKRTSQFNSDFSKSVSNSPLPFINFKAGGGGVNKSISGISKEDLIKNSPLMGPSNK